MGGVFNTVNMQLYHYAENNPIKYTDPTGRAPRNMTEKDRDAYKNEIARWINYNKNTNKMGLPSTYDCADVATYLYGRGITKTSTGRKTSDLLVSGKALGDIALIGSKDFFPENTDNISFYDEKSFNNSYVEIGTVLVWKGPGYDAKKKEGWIGHVATVVDVKRDDKGNVTNITIIQGHTGGDKTEVVNITSQKDLDEYLGTFLGFGEIGKDSTLYDTTFDK